MRMRRTLAFFVFAICALAIAVETRAAEVRHGDWTIAKSDFPGKVEFSLIERHDGGMSNHQSLWSVSVFQGLDLSKAGRQDVNFTITRDAGKIDCEGFLKDGDGAGLFHFQPDPNYPREMQSLGFPLDDEKQFAMAVQDVTLDFAKEMKGQHLSNLDTDKLVAFRIFGVDSAFIQAMHTEGLKTTDSDKFVAFRIHGVSPQMVRTLRQAGYSPDEDMLIALRIHGATPEWIAQIKQRGYDHLDLEKMIAFRIHGVSPEFIDKVQGLGYAHPDPDELIAMRIHNVTPEYIADMRSRGIKDLSIDKLVSMRIHGID
ncbi:MAG: hypothetical protein ACRD3B_08175 [Candidatus Sulfotelmatobacter sp.]